MKPAYNLNCSFSVATRPKTKKILVFVRSLSLIYMCSARIISGQLPKLKRVWVHGRAGGGGGSGTKEFYTALPLKS